MGVFFEIFGWHRRAYIAWVDVDEYYLTLALMVGIFAFGGVLLGRGVMRRILSAVLIPVIWSAGYLAFVVVINNVIFNNNAGSLAIGAAFAFTGIYSIFVLALNLQKLIKEKKK